MTLRLYPLPSLYDEDVDSVRASTPVDVSSFYVKRTYNVPWSVLPTTFVFETDQPQSPHKFTINKTEVIAFVPAAEVTSIQLLLAKGSNYIEVETPSFASKGVWTSAAFYQRYDQVNYDGTAWVCLQPHVNITPEEGPFWTSSAAYSGEKEVLQINVAATGVETWLRALGREVYLAGGKRVREVRDQLLSPWTTRVSAHLVPFSDLFLPARMPKIQQTRMAIITSTGQRLGFGDGVLQLATAVSHSTPWVTRPRNSEFTLPGQDHIYSYVTTYPTTGEDKGRLLDIWSPNQCLAAKLAITQLALAVGGNDVPEPKPLKLVDFDDYQVLLSLSGGPTEVHYMNPMSAECANIEFDTDCMANMRVFVEMEGVVDVFMNTPQLPFDTMVESPILFGFWDEGNNLDMSAGSGSPGLGAGDEFFDTVDQDDPTGTGFLGVSLSRRFDAPMCLDTRIQRGQRMAKYIPPLASIDELTPDPATSQAGTAFIIDTASPGAPPANAGDTAIWAISQLNFIYQGDYLRLENPDQEVQVASAWPAFDVNSIVIKSTTATLTASGSQYVVSAPGFFEKKHEGMGVQLNSSGYASIASVDPLAGTAVLAGNPSLPTGAVTVDVYLPKRDPAVTLGAPFAGNRVYQVELVAPLSLTLADRAGLDQRHAPLSVGGCSFGDTTLRIASDIVPLVNDRLFFTNSDFCLILTVHDSGLTHHTTGFKVYDIFLDAGAPVSLSDNDPLFSVTANPCWEGDPVTPLRLITLAPSSFIVP